MEYTKLAITKAISGGYKQFNAPRKDYVEVDKALLDPLFWQSLAKAWHKDNPGNLEEGAECDCWKSDWHRFIDSLADGHTPEQFFKQLLSNK